MNRLLRNTSIAVALAGATIVPVISTPSANAGTTADRSENPVSLAVFGDVPYGTDQEAAFGDLIDAINSDPKVRVGVHVGDIKSGSTTCSDERFAAVYDAFEQLEDPLVYTPGDNEWADCHRTAAGAYNPLERLDALRELFFPEPGSVLGRRPMRVDYQPEFVENVRWIESRTAFATLHVIGSSNGLSPWSGIGFNEPTPEQSAEVAARKDAALAWIDETFDAAEAANLQGVVLFMQADTFPPSSAEAAFVERISTRTAAFDGEVLLLQGDSHVYRVDNPLGLENFTRIVVHGEDLPFEYLRLTIDPDDPELFSWDRVATVGSSTGGPATSKDVGAAASRAAGDRRPNQSRA
ncbi:hypothetical protein [Actinopolymorpha pittospori]|uniref:Calcineurin-like phosphoesterase n=1 Tax=Actinopolymorpha pittospori TaxID=648752 RepID=A0A927R9W7_9ACTN|nr:hypothetical protein [Actinopolymorpha pittospori]MBE1606949.1 hypothetical protein [Actinopolymorpha pittospori]